MIAFLLQILSFGSLSSFSSPNYAMQISALSIQRVYNSNLPSLPVSQVIYLFFTTSTRLPVFLNISTRFGNSQNLLFLPVNVGKIRETTIDFMKVNI